MARPRSVLALPGGPSSEDVPARDGGHEQQLDRLLLTYDDPADLLLRLLAQRREVDVRRMCH